MPILKSCDPREQQRLDGERKLAALLCDVFDRTQGQPTKEDADSIKQLCRDNGIPKDRAQEIVNRFREQWLKAHPPRRAPQAGELAAVTLPGDKPMKFTYVPPGSFLMGSPATEKNRGNDEKQH
jgi:hypothetical protein